MQKIIKGIVITLLVIAAIYFVPRIILQNRISNADYTKPAELITDFSLKDESTYEIAEGEVIMQIPTYYASQNLRDYYITICDARLKNKQLAIIYKPFEHTIDKVIPGYSQTYNNLMADYENADTPFPTSLFYQVPNDMFYLMKDVYLADKNNYNFWNLKDALLLDYLLKIREEGEKTDITVDYIYERDDVRAIVAEEKGNPGTYIVLIFRDDIGNSVYSFVISTHDTDDIIKLLNSFEFK